MVMKTLHKYIFTFAATLSLCSCNSWFDGMLDDELPLNDLVPENAIVDGKSAERALLGAYSYLDDSQYLGGYLGVDLITQSHIRLNLMVAKSPSVFEAEELAVFAYDETNTNFVSPWSHVYKMINAANNVIHYTELVSDDKCSQEMKLKILAEARFLRGFCNMYLLERYAQFYDTSSKYGLILRMEPSMLSNNNRARSTVAESYEAVYDDLRYAAENAPEFSTVYRICKTTAKAFLANYLLVRGTDADRAEALKLADEVLESDDFKLEKNYGDIFTKKYSSRELMFTQDTNEPFGYDSNIRGLGQTLGRGQYLPKEIDGSQYFNIIDNDTTERYIAAHDTVTFPTAKEPTFVWKKHHTMDEEAMPMYYMRLAQVYLIKAEALSYQSGATIAEVLDVVNVLRERANEPLFEATDYLTMDDVREEIFKEYIRELGAENGDPFFYAVRTRKGSSRLLTFYNPYFVDDKTLCYPIPVKELETNNLAEQNPY